MKMLMIDEVMGLLRRCRTENHRPNIQKKMKIYLSQEENPGWLGYIGDYTTQLYKGL